MRNMRQIIRRYLLSEHRRISLKLVTEVPILDGAEISLIRDIG